MNFRSAEAPGTLLEMNPVEVSVMFRQIEDAPEAKCEHSHVAVNLEGKRFKMPTPCTGEASFRFVWPKKNVSQCVCSAFEKDFREWSLIKDEARVVKI